VPVGLELGLEFTSLRPNQGPKHSSGPNSIQQTNYGRELLSEVHVLTW